MKEETITALTKKDRLLGEISKLGNSGSDAGEKENNSCNRD
jgi:hypothetical protein